MFYYSTICQRNTFCRKKNCNNYYAVLYQISDESLQPTYIAGYLICTDDRYAEDDLRGVVREGVVDYIVVMKFRQHKCLALAQWSYVG